MKSYLVKTFTRKWPDAPNPTGTKGVTMILMLVSGNVKSLDDESVAALSLVDSDGIMQVVVEGQRKAPEFAGSNASGILLRM